MVTRVTEPHEQDASTASTELIATLAHHSALFRAFTDHCPVGVGFVSSAFDLVYANARWRELSRFHGPLPASAEVTMALVDPEDRQAVIATFARSTELGQEIRQRVRVDATEPGEQPRHLTLSVRTVRGLDDEVLGYAIGLSEVTELVSTIDELRRSEERFRSATEALPVGVFRADPDGLLTWANEPMATISGHALEDVAHSMSVFDFVHPDDREVVIERSNEALVRGVALESTHRMIRADGSVRWVIARSSALRDDRGHILEHVGTIEDITELHLRSEGLAHQAAHDLLTGLPNRARLETIIAELCQHQSDRCDIGIVFLDLDGFKHVNDTYGHRAGDAALIEVSRRLVSVLRGGDVVGRYGGDEFVVVCPQVTEHDAMARLASRLHHAIAEDPIRDGERTYRIGASIGTAIGPHPRESPSAFIHRADQAMYEAKRASGGRPESDQP